MPRRAQGEGTLIRRADGRYAGALTVAGKRRWVYGTTRREAADKLAKLRRAVADGLPVGDERRTVGSYLTDWAAALGPPLVPETIDRYQRLVRLHLMPVLGDVRLARLGPADIRRLYSERAKVLAPSSVRLLGAVLNRALNQAVRDGLLVRNPAWLVDKPALTQRTPVVLSTVNARALLDAAKGDRLEALYVLALSTGMRLGELLGLRWPAVDLAQRRLSVRTTTVQRGRQVVVVERTKTKRAHPVSLTAAAVAALTAHRAAQDGERARAGSAWVEQDLVFSTEQGQPLQHRQVRRRWFYPLLERLGLPRMHFHDLRHTVATLLLEQGVSPRIVADLLGHSSTRLTTDIYSHVSPTLQQQATDVLGRLFGEDEVVSRDVKPPPEG